MLREQFLKLIMQEAAQGFNRGVELFIESLESEISRDEAIFENNQAVGEYIEHLFEQAK